MRQVSAGYGRDVVLRGLDLALHPGEFTAVVGDNGSGKTTLARVAGGLLKPSGGEVVFHHETGSGRSWGRARLRPGLDVALLFQNPADQLFTDSVEEEVAFGPLNYRRFDAARHERLLEESDLVGLRSRLPMALSAGQQQRTALAACLSLLPRLVILDEPTLGQDWRHLQRLMDFLRELNRQGMAILLITHDYKLVHRYAHRVVWMDGGRIVLDGHLRHAGRGAA
jgi:energy-coupling factor transporter ATP-binding protein EcfA2